MKANYKRMDMKINKNINRIQNKGLPPYQHPRGFSLKMNVADPKMVLPN